MYSSTSSVACHSSGSAAGVTTWVGPELKYRYTRGQKVLLCGAEFMPLVQASTLLADALPNLRADLTQQCGCLYLISPGIGASLYLSPRPHHRFVAGGTPRTKHCSLLQQQNAPEFVGRPLLLISPFPIVGLVRKKKEKRSITHALSLVSNCSQALRI